MSDELFNVATNFLVNGGDLPEYMSADPRFIFLSAMLKDIHACSKGNTVKIDGVDKRVTTLETLLKWAAGIIPTSGAILALLAKLGII